MKGYGQNNYSTIPPLFPNPPLANPPPPSPYPFWGKEAGVTNKEGKL